MADTLKAAVLGCGPAGLLAAHGISWAAHKNGLEAEIRIYSRKRYSQLFGCQYLHEAIPGLKLASQPVSYQLTGSITGYRQKVYGTAEDVAVSPALLETNHYAWDIREAYRQLWERYEDRVEDYFLSPGSWRLLRQRLDGMDIIMSTVPAGVLCSDLDECTFKSETVWAMGDAPPLGRRAAVPVELPDGTILCSGKVSQPWYRVAHVFGHHTVEWPADAVPPHGASRVTKPLSTTCRCNPEVIRSGRYARWQKGVLAHTSFFDGVEAVSERIGARAT